VSYAAGLTRLPLVLFVLLTIAGLVPANLVTAWVGAEAAGDIPLRLWLAGWGIVLVGLVGWRVWRRRLGPVRPAATSARSGSEPTSPETRP
jgi:uncharacterized membrane protein YdjX (TVP38/TMEM64 family)